jgi:hypothetical protein
MAVCAIASASASATVLCTWAPASHECGPSTYGLGTEIKSSLASGTEAGIYMQDGQKLISCSASTLNMKVSSQPVGENNVNANATAYSFSSCTGGTVTVLGSGQQAIKWISGTHNGLAGGYNRVDIRPNAYGLDCGEYQIWGPGEIVGGTSPTIKYVNGEIIAAVGNMKAEGGICPMKWVLKATYSVSTPTPLYIEQR